MSTQDTSSNCKPVKIHPPIYEVQSPDGEIYNLNEYELLELRVQIKNALEDGWCVLFENQMIPIFKDGTLEHWPPGLCDQMEKYWILLL